MVQIVAATFKDGVFKPDQRPALSESTRVRLVVETINGDESEQGGRRDESWATLQRLWKTSTFNSAGDRLNREQLHERG
jgi:predicted DNA-binding antitoxin AbrB/MazE fold protein